MAKKRKKRINSFPVIGKYEDTPTKADLGVINFWGDAGKYRFSVGSLKNVMLDGCRFQLKVSDVKRRRKFYKLLSIFLNFSSGFSHPPETTLENLPILFGLLKLRKGKKRLFVLIQGADVMPLSKVLTIHAVIIDNLLYLDLMNRYKVATLQ